MNSIDAFILVGGRSSRMGSDKASVEFRGQRMVECVANSIREALPIANIRIVAANKEKAVTFYDVAAIDSILCDVYPDRGPAGGLFSALMDSNSEWAFLAACDMPLLSAAIISLMAGKLNSDIDAVIPVQPDGRQQPLAAYYRVETVRDRLTELVKTNGESPSLFRVLEPMNVRNFTFQEYQHLTDSAMIFTNINSPDDLETIRRSR